MKELNPTGDLTPVQNTNDPRAHIGSAFDDLKQNVVEGMHRVSKTLRQKAGESPAGKQVADWLEHAARELGEMDPARVKNDIRRKIGENPGRSLLVAGAAGLALGILLRRR